MCARVCVSLYTLVGPPLPGLLSSHTDTSPQQQANGSRVNVLYSTPACYLWQLNKANLTWYLGGLGSLGMGGMPCGS